MLRLLEEAEGALAYGEWRQAGIEAGLKDRTASRSIEYLVKDGRVQKINKRYLAVNETQQEEENNAAD